MSTDTSTMTEAQRDQAEARRIYRASCAAGDPITGTALAEQFNRKERWGQERIAEAKAEAKADGRAWSDQPLPGFEALSLPPVTTPPAESAETTVDGNVSPVENDAPLSGPPATVPVPAERNGDPRGVLRKPQRPPARRVSRAKPSWCGRYGCSCFRPQWRSGAAGLASEKWRASAW